MTEFKNTERELHFFRLRLSAVGGFVFFCFALLLARFVWLQVYKHSDYAAQAEDNRISIVPLVPNRGLIVDRNGVVLARNFSAYTLEITPSKIEGDLDTVIDGLAEVVDIQSKDRKRFKKLLEEQKSFESTPIRTRLSDAEVARFTAQRYRFPGVEIQARLFRQYPLGEVASHVIGYIGRVSQKDADKIDAGDDAANYSGTEYIGKEGLEKSYEKELHGITGVQEVEISAGGRAVRTLSRTSASSGNNLILSIDIELQKIVEEAFGDRRGAMVAIDPATGDVLAFVSKPTYDPNLFVEGIDQQSWDELNTSADRPLVNRPLTGTYPPGSTYKPFMALAALQLGLRTPSMSINDPGHFVFGNHTFRDDKPQGHGVINMHDSIVKSCDIYYFMLANDMGVDAIHDFMKPFGFGDPTGIDLENERGGLLPSTAWKRGHFTNAGATEMVRRRYDLAGHRPGLQCVYPAADRQGGRDTCQQRRGDAAASGQGDRKRCDARAYAGCKHSERAHRFETGKPRSHQAGDGRCHLRAGRYRVSGVSRCGICIGRKDRYGTGGRLEKE